MKNSSAPYIQRGDRRQAILDEYRRNPDASLHEIARELHINVRNVHYHLTMLERMGIVKLRHRMGGPHGPYKFKISMEKLSKIRSEAATKSRGVDAHFQLKKSKIQSLEARIDMVVKRAKEREAKDPGYDVMQGKTRLRLTGAHRVG
jgi:predicted ArsR family transcriptional regulator